MFHHHLRNELWKLFGKKRTISGSGHFCCRRTLCCWPSVLPIGNGKWRTLAGNGYIAEEYISTLTVALVMLIPQILLLMPLYTSLVGGDLVAKEAEDGTLRMILSRPISRLRLLSVKWLAGLVFAAVLVLALGGTALFFARLWFPWKGMFVLSLFPERIFAVLTVGEGFRLYLISHLLMTLMPPWSSRWPSCSLVST